MLDTREQLLRLLQIQELVFDVQSARAVVDGAPGRIEEIESRFRERNAEYVALKERFESIEADRRARSAELQTLEDGRRKFMEALMQVKNQREYSAVLKELDAVKGQVSAHEDAILKAMEEAETLKADLDRRAEHIEQERSLVEKEHAQVEEASAAAAEQILRCEAERARIESELPEDLVAAAHRLEENRQGLFLARVEKELCQSCYVRVRPQAFQEIKAAQKIHNCGHCHRFLYYEPALRPSEAEPPYPGTSSAGVEAANGGAV